MDTRQATREIRLKRWAEVLRERQASGLSIAAWCEAKGVSRQTNFYWQRKLRALACEALELRRGSAETGMAWPEFAQYHRPAEIPASVVGITGTESSTAALVVHLACGKVEIHSGADRETIRNTLQALRELC